MIKKCQVFTPAKNVEELLDFVGYKTDLYGKKVVENACGDGNILKIIVQRYIQDSINNKKNIYEIKQGLENDIFAFEIDPLHYNNCIKNLNLLVESFNIKNVQWNISNKDFLKQNIKNKFDYVIGNPPYITYRDLDVADREYLKKWYHSCQYGKFDYCYAFIEASIISLKEYGKLAYLIPSSIFKNVYAQELRDIILPYITKIIDYTTQKLFEKALTSSAILICEKKKYRSKIDYIDVVNQKEYQLEKQSLSKKWIFSNYKREENVKKVFGDYFIAANSVATLFNNAYVLKEFVEENNYVIYGDYKIERDIIKIGASSKALKQNRTELIIFPYYYEKGDLKKYNSIEFEKKFPEATRYLMTQRENLDKRKSDTGIEWFEYGRSQALAHLDQPKLLLSSIVTKKVKIYELSREHIPYSGIYIVSKQKMPLDEAKKILESDAFYNYVKKIGINASGSSLRITSADINNFEF